MNNKKSLQFGLGFTALSASMLGTFAPAHAANPAIPTCGTLNSFDDTQAAAAIASYNAAQTNILKTKASYKKLEANVAKADKALKAAKKIKGAKGKKAVAAATKALNAAKAARTKAQDAVFIKLFSATVTPQPVSAGLFGAGDNKDNTKLWNWGDYTARVMVKNKVAVDICVKVSEDASNSKTTDNSDHATASDLNTSLTQYQEPYLPVLRTEALNGAKISKSAILARVATKVTTDVDNFFGAEGPVVTAGGYVTIGANSGATYTIEGFYNSVQAALVKSNLKA